MTCSGDYFVALQLSACYTKRENHKPKAAVYSRLQENAWLPTVPDAELKSGDHDRNLILLAGKNTETVRNT